MENRRSFIKKSGIFVAASTLPFPNILFSETKEKLGIALLGLGGYSSGQLAPALQLTEHCELKGIITGSPEKIPVWQKKYNIKDSNVYNYDNMHTIADNDEIDVIYVVTPTFLHEKYAVMAANTGKHVWCEKPMAITATECQNIITACKKNRVKLAIGYRMQHEPVTQTIIKWADTKPYGNIKSVKTEAGFRIGQSGGWRLDGAKGGGAMYDMGVYPLNATRYSTGLEPISVSARHETERKDLFLNNAHEITYFNLEFPHGIKADCRVTYADSVNYLDVKCENGSYKLEPFSSYNGVKGKTTDGKVLKAFKGNEQAKQMDADALSVMQSTALLVPGEEGMRDIRIVEAIYKSASNNSEVINL
ncbi:MAG: Gfo/Idh/MocA family oxidoreductase [Leeuwenhoekiella sp.]